ncbi:MAG: alpha/beta hydrolase [Flavobacteriaceae bacterium]|nr:alpha/beta hydrolase [Flavobacteriaceae bacterium]
MRAIFSALTLVLLTIACKDEVKIDHSISAGSVAGDIVKVTTTLTEEEDRTIEYWKLIVPENRSDANTRLISLPVKIIRSSSESPSEPLFYLSGGPGGSNLSHKPHDKILEKRDVVLVGYRGVDGMVRLDCADLFASSSGNNLFDPETSEAIRERMKKCVSDLQAKGVDLDGYTMLEVVADLDAARKALGNSRINLLSASYGTRLAQFYGYEYPEKVIRSVMVSVNPPGHFVWERETLDRQINYYAQLCAQDPYCSSRTNDLAETMRKVNHDMPKKWLFFGIDPDKVRMAAFMGLYHRGSAASVFDTYVAAENGDPSGLALVSLMFDVQMGMMDFSWGDSYAKAYPDFDPNRDYLHDMGLGNSIMGSPGSQTFATMDAWPGKALPERFKKPQISEVETLLLSGNIDFSTPAEFATDELLPFLPNGKQVIVSVMGHTGDVMRFNEDAFIHLLTTYLESGTVDDSKFETVPMNFEPDDRFQVMAKIGLAILVALVILLIWLGYKLGKKVILSLGVEKFPKKRH